MQPQLESITADTAHSSIVTFKLETAGYPPFWHYHPEIELTYIKRGRGLRFVGDHVEPFEEGDLVLLGGNLPHQWVSEDHNDQYPSVAFVNQFSQTIVSGELPEFSPIRDLISLSAKGIKFHDPGKHLTRQIEDLNTSGPVPKLLGLFEILNELATKYHHQTLSGISFGKERLAGKHQSRIALVTSHIFNNLERPISLKEMAGFTHLAVPAFCRWFKSAMGKSFVTYLHQVRIERACQLLFGTDLPIAQIAYQTGFESLSNFNRIFKRVKKEAPRDYRERRAVV